MASPTDGLVAAFAPACKLAAAAITRAFETRLGHAGHAATAPAVDAAAVDAAIAGNGQIGDDLAALLAKCDDIFAPHA